MKTLVLGCGPSGLLAAHAAAQLGSDVLVFSKPRKSDLFGCQYLHAPIPGLTPVEGTLVDYLLKGTDESYRAKVYGPNYRGSVSPEDLVGKHFAWDIRSAYDTLWEMYGSYVQPIDFGELNLLDQVVDKFEPDLILSSIPAPLLCKMPEAHAFHSEDVWALGDAPERGQKVPYSIPENTVICDGTRDRAWYRASKVFGYGTLEWPYDRKPPIPGVALVQKPLANTCDCRSEIVRLGRYGKWEKGVLSHEAYFETRRQVRKVLDLGQQGTLL